MRPPSRTARPPASESVGGGRSYRRSATGGGDDETLRSAAVPTVEFAFARDDAHAVDEYTTVGLLRRNAATSARLPAALAAALDLAEG